jgi:hypothetical protein
MMMKTKIAKEGNAHHAPPGLVGSFVSEPTTTFFVVDSRELGSESEEDGSAPMAFVPSKAAPATAIVHHHHHLQGVVEEPEEDLVEEDNEAVLVASDVSSAEEEDEDSDEDEDEGTWIC